MYTPMKVNPLQLSAYTQISYNHVGEFPEALNDVLQLVSILLCESTTNTEKVEPEIVRDEKVWPEMIVLHRGHSTDV